MVVVAQLVERWLVEPDVAGSSPVDHPKSGPREQSRGLRPLWEGTIVALAAPDLTEEVQAVDELALGLPWVTIVWNDPVNLMSYVSYVFRSYFGFSPAEADRRMLQVHNEGRAIVANGTREEMERHVEAMHEFGLWATLDRAGE